MVKTASVKQIAEQIVPPLEKAEYVWFRVTVLKKANSILNLDNLQVGNISNRNPNFLIC